MIREDLEESLDLAQEIAERLPESAQPGARLSLCMF
jgi:hypothetical protein